MTRNRRPRTERLLLAAALGLLLAACAGRLPSGPAFTPTIAAAEGLVLGQTFVPEWDGLSGIHLYLSSVDPPPEAVRVAVHTHPGSPQPLWTGTVAIPAGLEPGWFRFPIGGIAGKAGISYYVSFEVKGPGSLVIATAPGGAYLDGALHRDGEPVDRQFDFHLDYDPLRATAGLLADGGAAVAWLLAFGLAFALPGWALFSLLWPGWEEQRLLNKIILAAVAGTAVYPIALLGLRLIGLPFGEIAAWGIPFAAIASFAWRYRKGSWRPKISFRRPELIDLLTLAALLAVLVTRLLPLRVLAAGMWGDSVHHTLITQLLVERGGLFSSWAPYAPLTTFTYHFGFHTTATVLTWLTGQPADRTVLWAGQYVNFLAVAGLIPAVEAMVRTLGRTTASPDRLRAAGLVAVVAVGLLSPAPMIYINWGRYTQIAGQALLLAWMVPALDLFREDRRGYRREALTWILLAGLALTHYRVLIFAVLWAAAYWLVQVRAAGAWYAVTRSARMAVGAGLLFLPWFWIVFGGGIFEIVGSQLATPATAVSEAVENYNRLGDPARFLSPPVWALATLALIFGIARREKIAAVTGLWGLLVLLSANPGWLGLPGTGAINNFAVLLAAYLPAGLLLGAGTVWLSDLPAALRPRLRFEIPAPWAKALAVAGLASVCVLGGAYQLSTLTLKTSVLVTRPDLRAFAWVRENTPESAVFLVNMAEAGGGHTLTGTDAGWWLPYFTGREAVMPPFIFISEGTRPPDLRLELLDLYAGIQERGPADGELVDALRAWGVTHVYLGQQQGRVNGRSTALSPSVLQSSEDFSLLYHEDRIWVFSLEK